MCLPGKPHGQRSLVDCSPRGCKELDTTEQLTLLLSYRWYPSTGRKWRGTQKPFDEGERGEWKGRLETQNSKNEEHGIWSHHFMASRRGKVEAVTDFILLGSKITAGGDCSHEIKRCLLLGRKAMTNLDSVLKSSDITLMTKVHIVKAMVFPVVMYRCESWTIKKAECQRIDPFKLWCLWRLLRVPWSTRSSSHSLEINPVFSLEVCCWNWSSNRLATWCEDTAHWKRPWCWESLKVKGEAESRGWDGSYHWLNGHECEQTLK